VYRDPKSREEWIADVYLDVLGYKVTLKRWAGKIKYIIVLNVPGDGFPRGNDATVIRRRATATV
jgi:hypothetical protein